MSEKREAEGDLIKRYNNINCPFLSTYHMPDTMPSTLHVLISLNPSNPMVIIHSLASIIPINYLGGRDYSTKTWLQRQNYNNVPLYFLM